MTSCAIMDQTEFSLSIREWSFFDVGALEREYVNYGGYGGNRRSQISKLRWTSVTSITPAIYLYPI